MEPNKLRFLMTKYPGFPEPSLKTGGNTLQSAATYYDVRLAQAWWSRVKRELAAKT